MHVYGLYHVLIKPAAKLIQMTAISFDEDIIYSMNIPFISGYSVSCQLQNFSYFVCIWMLMLREMATTPFKTRKSICKTIGKPVSTLYYPV